MCCCVNLRTKGHFTFLPSQVVSQQLASKGLTRLRQLIATRTWELLEQEDWEPNNFEHCSYEGGKRKTLFILELLIHFELS